MPLASKYTFYTIDFLFFYVFAALFDSSKILSVSDDLIFKYICSIQGPTNIKVCFTINIKLNRFQTSINCE